MFDRIDPTLLPFLDSESKQLLQQGVLSVEDHQALLDEAKARRDAAKPSDTPTPEKGDKSTSELSRQNDDAAFEAALREDPEMVKLREDTARQLRIAAAVLGDALNPRLAPRDRGLLDKVTSVELGPASDEIQVTGYSNAEVRDTLERRNLPRKVGRSRFGSANGGEGSTQPAHVPKRGRSRKDDTKDPHGKPGLPAGRERRNSIGWLALAFALVERGLDVIGFQNVVAGALLFVGAFVAFVLWFIGWEKARQWRFGKRAVIVCAGALVYFPLVAYQLYTQYKSQHPERPETITVVPSPPRPPIYRPFISAAEEYTKSLGAPQSEAEMLRYSEVAQHERSKAIWAGDPVRRWFVLDISNPNWTPHEDPHPEYDLTFFNDDCNRMRLNTPKDKSPPLGGLAKLWYTDLDETAWEKRMGGREWHCYYNGIAHLQRFEGGYIVGPFTSSETDETAQIFVLPNDQNWALKMPPNVKAPSCNRPDPALGGPCPPEIKRKLLPNP